MSSSMTGARGMMGATGGEDIIPSGYQKGQLSQFTPEQFQLFKRMFSNVGPQSFLSRLSQGDESAFNQMEAPAMRQFGQLQGNLASRFSGMGSGARRSSGFQNAMNQATSDFAMDLASRRTELQRQALMDLFNMSNTLLGQRPYEQFLVDKQQNPSFLQSIIGGTLPMAGAALGGIFGGLPGAKLGGSIGGAAGNAFMR